MRELFNPTETYEERAYEPGTRMMDGRTSEEYIFVYAAAEVPATTVAVIDPNFNAAQITSANSSPGDRCGVAHTTIPAKSYGWLSRAGKGLIQVGANANARVALNTTNTPGRLDDGGNAADVVDGIVLTANRGAGVGTQNGVWDYPRIRI